MAFLSFLSKILNDIYVLKYKNKIANMYQLLLPIPPHPVNASKISSSVFPFPINWFTTAKVNTAISKFSNVISILFIGILFI